MIYAADGMMTPRNIFLSGYGSTTNQILHGKRILILAGCIPIYKTVLPMFGSFYQPPTTNQYLFLSPFLVCVYPIMVRKTMQNDYPVYLHGEPENSFCLEG